MRDWSEAAVVLQHLRAIRSDVSHLREAVRELLNGQTETRAAVIGFVAT